MKIKRSKEWWVAMAKLEESVSGRDGMSELIESVDRDIANAIQDEGYGFHVARAAIRAVAEWSMSNYYAETSILRFWTEVLAKLEEPKP